MSSCGRKCSSACGPVVLGARYVAVAGRVQEESGVIHVVADKLDGSHVVCWRGSPNKAPRSTAWRAADEVRRPVEDQREAHLLRRPRNRLLRLMREMPELASDLDVPARGSAHAPNRRVRNA